MDDNVLSCSKCGHTVSESAEACAYCGTPVSSDESPPPSDIETPEIEAQAEESSLAPEEGSVPGLTLADEAAGTLEESEVTSDTGPADPIQPEDNQPVSVDPAGGAASDIENQLSDFDDNIDFQLPDDELIMELDPGESVEDPAPATGDKPELKSEKPSGQNDIVDLEQQAAETTAEVIPLAGKAGGKTPSDPVPDMPETAVLEENTEDTSESETLGADILELVQVDDSEQESGEGQVAEKSKTEGGPSVETGEKPSAVETADNSETNDDELDAILLTPAEDGQSSDQPLSGADSNTGETADSEAPVELAAPVVGDAAKSDGSSEKGQDKAGADIIQKQAEQQATLEAQKIEKASQELAEAKKKQKPAADPNAIKKQKAALARAKALKVKKLKLAKAQALKKKKLKLAKAQALKKQKAAQAGIGAANKEVAAGSKSPEADNSNKGIKTMNANTKMLGLLKKYEGQAIGINYDNSADIKEAQLVEANDEFFSVFVKDKELSYNHPLKTILTIIEGQDGVETGKSEQKEKYKAVVKVYPLVLF